MRDKKKPRHPIFEFIQMAPVELNPLIHPHGWRWIPTPDDWYPTFDNGTVRAGVHIITSTLDLRVSFWGNDDFGLEKDIPLTVEDYFFWNGWLNNLAIIEKKTLYELGFVHV